MNSDEIVHQEVPLPAFSILGSGPESCDVKEKVMLAKKGQEQGGVLVAFSGIPVLYVASSKTALSHSQCSLWEEHFPRPRLTMLISEELVQRTKKATENCLRPLETYDLSEFTERLWSFRNLSTSLLDRANIAIPLISMHMTLNVIGNLGPKILYSRADIICFD